MGRVLGPRTPIWIILEKVGPHKKEKQIDWGQEKDRQVKEIFLKGVLLKDTVSSCTMLATYRLTDFPNNVAFEDPSCLMTQKIEALLK